jgi:hypothetical protein
MKKSYYIIKCLFACLVMLAFACHKDTQDYTYNEINDLKVQDAVTTFTVAQNDSLIILPNLVESMPGGEEYTYSWTVGTSGTTTTSVVSAKKDLRIKAVMSPAQYTVIFRAASKKTGISAISRYTVTVQGVFYGGWYVVGNKDGKAKLSLIRTDDVIFDNPIETQNSKTYPGKALYASYSSTIGVLYFFTDQNVYKFNPNDLFELGDLSKTLPGFTTELPFKPSPFYLGNQIDQFVIANGGLYMGLGPIFYETEVLKPFSERIPGDYNLFPGVFITSSYNLFYDNKYKRFMQNVAFARSVDIATATPGTPASPTTFDMANVGRTMMAFDKGVANEHYYLMENSSGVRFLMSTTYSSTTRSAAPGVNFQLSNSPEINSATNFATSTSVKQMYYTVGNKIYLHDINANSARVIYTFPAGYLIKDIELVRTTPQKLVVATNNAAAGEVYYFDISPLGEFVNNTYLKKFAGFGEITQVSPR